MISIINPPTFPSIYVTEVKKDHRNSKLIEVSASTKVRLQYRKKWYLQFIICTYTDYKKNEKDININIIKELLLDAYCAQKLTTIDKSFLNHLQLDDDQRSEEERLNEEYF